MQVLTDGPHALMQTACQAAAFSVPAPDFITAAGAAFADAAAHPAPPRPHLAPESAAATAALLGSSPMAARLRGAVEAAAADPSRCGGHLPAARVL